MSVGKSQQIDTKTVQSKLSRLKLYYYFTLTSFNSPLKKIFYERELILLRFRINLSTDDLAHAHLKCNFKQPSDLKRTKVGEHMIYS